MIAAIEQLRELVDAGDAPDLPPLPAQLMCTLDLPKDLPAELAIGDVAQAAGVSAHTLRYYERIGLVEVDRDAGGRRVYDLEALARVVFVTRLRRSDMPIANRSSDGCASCRPRWPSSTTRSPRTAGTAHHDRIHQPQEEEL